MELRHLRYLSRSPKNSILDAPRLASALSSLPCLAPCAR
jgi:hypothetical protein